MKQFANFDVIPRNERVERWTNVKRVLEGLDQHARDHHWNMRFYGKLSECGTIACAAGHCGMDPWFRSQGFFMDLRLCDCGEPYCGKLRMSSIHNFFGSLGSITIFQNSIPRSVDEVIDEVVEHITKLESMEDPKSWG